VGCGCGEAGRLRLSFPSRFEDVAPNGYAVARAPDREGRYAPLAPCRSGRQHTGMPSLKICLPSPATRRPAPTGCARSSACLHAVTVSTCGCSGAAASIGVTASRHRGSRRGAGGPLLPSSTARRFACDGNGLQAQQRPRAEREIKRRVAGRLPHEPESSRKATAPFAHGPPQVWCRQAPAFAGATSSHASERYRAAKVTRKLTPRVASQYGAMMGFPSQDVWGRSVRRLP
jgi:hypothetical protein